MKIGLSACAWTTQFDRTHLCPFSLGSRMGMAEFEAFSMLSRVPSNSAIPLLTRARADQPVSRQHGSQEY